MVDKLDEGNLDELHCSHDKTIEKLLDAEGKILNNKLFWLECIWILHKSNILTFIIFFRKNSSIMPGLQVQSQGQETAANTSYNDKAPVQYKNSIANK
jgi:hypothetical protein